MLALAPGLMRVLRASSVYRGIGSFVKAKLCVPLVPTFYCAPKESPNISVSLSPQCCKLDLLPTSTPRCFGFVVRSYRR